MSGATWLCRQGFHKWRFVSMSDRRTIEVPPHMSHICRLVERCDRCGLRWTQEAADVPKRVKMPSRNAAPSDGAA